PISRERPSGSGWVRVHIPRLLPRMGKVAQGQERGAASNGKTALRPRAGSGDELVPAKPASADPRAANPSDRNDARPLRLLRHIGQLSSTRLVRPQGCADLAASSGEITEPCPVPVSLLATARGYGRHDHGKIR